MKKLFKSISIFSFLISINAMSATNVFNFSGVNIDVISDGFQVLNGTFQLCHVEVGSDPANTVSTAGGPTGLTEVGNKTPGLEENLTDVEFNLSSANYDALIKLSFCYVRNGDDFIYNIADSLNVSLNLNTTHTGDVGEDYLDSSGFAIGTPSINCSESGGGTFGGGTMTGGLVGNLVPLGLANLSWSSNPIGTQWEDCHVLVILYEGKGTPRIVGQESIKMTLDGTLGIVKD